MKLKVTEEIWKEGGMYVSYCPELDVASCGESAEQAKENLHEAILITIEETQKMGTFDQFIQEAGFEVVQKDTLAVRRELVGFEPVEIGI